MPVIRAASVDRRRPESNYLFQQQRNVFSQEGEDGVVEAIFGLLGTRNKWCVEFGAWDGVYLSNTCNLVRNHGWSAVMIEGDPKKCELIEQNHPQNPKVFAMNSMVGFTPGVDTIDDILAKTPIPRDFDFISIDVDGIDWYIWESIVVYRPRVVVIEFNPTAPNGVSFVQDRDMGIREGASLLAHIELAKTKGYELIAVTTRNAFFVVAEEFDTFKIADNSIDAMRLDRPNYIFHGYNGKVYHTMPKLNWYGKHVELKPDSLQLLSMHAATHMTIGSEAERARNTGHDLTTADGLIREVYELRSRKSQIPPDEHATRSRALWIAAKTYTDRHMPWGADPKSAA